MKIKPDHPVINRVRVLIRVIFIASMFLTVLYLPLVFAQDSLTDNGLDLYLKYVFLWVFYIDFYLITWGVTSSTVLLGIVVILNRYDKTQIPVKLEVKLAFASILTIGIMLLLFEAFKG